MIDKTKVLAEIERLKIEKRKENLPFHAIYYDGYDAACDKIIAYLNSLSAEPSKELEEAFDEVLPNPNWYISNDGEDAYNVKQMEEMFCAGANWQKEQMMKSAIEGCWIKRNRYTKENVLNGLSVTCDAIQKFRDGDKVRVLILKDDEQ